MNWSAKRRKGGSRTSVRGWCGWRSTPLPARPPDLRSQAHEFAARTSDLLNRTVTHGVRVSIVLQADGQVGWAGFGIDKRRPFPGRAIPLTLTGARPRCYLHVMHTLVQRYGVLITDQSSFGLYLDQDLGGCVFHYDYARYPGNPYPAAHLQVNATSTTFDELCGQLNRDAELARLHFPVGGRRFRPCLEDVVEMLIIEELANGRDGWETAIEEHRSWFRRIQLRAAVRDDPDAVREELRRLEEIEQNPGRYY
jgi:hypothetical protein